MLVLYERLWKGYNFFVGLVFLIFLSRVREKCMHDMLMSISRIASLLISRRLRMAGVFFRVMKTKIPKNFP